jgi:leader peptidase (prepilin peptidase) / N-methyltransferase
VRGTTGFPDGSVDGVAESPAPRTLRTAAIGGLCGVFAAASLAHSGTSARGFIGAAFCAVLVVLAAIDLQRRLLPNAIVLPAAGVFLVAQLAFYPGHALEWLLGSFGTALGLLLLLLINRQGLGMGDIKLGLLLGAVLGTHVLAALALGFVLALPVALYLLARHGAAARNAVIPFGPFLAAGSIVVLLTTSV